MRTTLRPANILARPLLNFLFPSNLCDAISKPEPSIEPRVCHAKSYERTVQAFNVFQNSAALHLLLCNNNNITRGPLQLQYSAIPVYK